MNQANALLYIAWEQADVRKFKDALETAEQIDDKSTRVEALIEILKKQAEVEDFTGAFASASRIEIEEPRSKAQALRIIAIAQAKANPFIDQAIKTAEQIDNESEQSEALLGIVKAQAEAGNFSAAETNQKRIKDVSKQQEALAEIAKEYAKAKKNDAALKIAKKINSQWQRWEIIDSGTEIFDITQRWEETLGSIAKMQAKSSSNEAARATFATVLSEPEQKPEISFLKVRTLLEVAEVQLKNEQKEVGADTASIALKMAQSIVQPTQQSIALALTADILVKAGKIKEAKGILKSAFEITQKISKNREDERSQSFKLIAEAQVRSGELDAALETLTMIKLASE